MKQAVSECFTEYYNIEKWERLKRRGGSFKLTPREKRFESETSYQSLQSMVVTETCRSNPN